MDKRPPARSQDIKGNPRIDGHRSGFFCSYRYFQFYGGEAIKGFVIAAPASGSGKTTVSMGFMAALKRRGLTVAPFKIGPDFIDPGHHTRITGRVSRNLDGWMLPETYNLACFRGTAEGVDIAVVEGVMGLYDGYDGKSDAGSTAQMAKLIGLPVVLVVDAASMARSAAALVQGFENFDPELRFAGVIFNNLGSDGHLKYLTDAMIGNIRMPCLGGISRDSRVTIPERHLGLVTEEEHALSDQMIAQLADLVDDQLNLDLLLAQLEDVIPKGALAPLNDTAQVDLVRIGVARDEAFCFYYQDNLDLLVKAGAEIVTFSPINDRHLPPDLDGLYLGGGYPELFAQSLSKNRKMLADMLACSRQDLPIYAECGGFMYLCESITDLDGRTHQMAGCFPAQVHMSSDLKALGYREITLKGNTILGEKGLVIRGHEFHYSTISGDLEKAAQPVYAVPRRKAGWNISGGYQINSTLGSYHHLHFGSCPQAAAGLVAACRLYKSSGGMGAGN